MRTDVKCCILIYYNHDKKTFNPGLILTDTNIETEIINIGEKMKEAAEKKMVNRLFYDEGWWQSLQQQQTQSGGQGQQPTQQPPPTPTGNP